MVLVHARKRGGPTRKINEYPYARAHKHKMKGNNDRGRIRK